jgi:hypothetical protein
MLVTVSDITNRLCRPGDDHAAMRERIMHWSRSDVLLAYNRRRLGKGTPRLFEHGAIVLAALLSQLTDMNFDVTGWGHVHMACDQVRDAARAWAGGNHRQRWLEITWTVGNPFSVRGLPEIRFGKDSTDPKLAGAVLVNLTQIFQRIGWNAADEQADKSVEIPQQTRSPRAAAAGQKVR